MAKPWVADLAQLSLELDGVRKREATLQGEATTLRQQLAKAHRKHEALLYQYRACHDEKDELRRKTARLTVALRKYGRHLKGTDGMGHLLCESRGQRTRVPPPCTCGLDAYLRETETGG